MRFLANAIMRGPLAAILVVSAAALLGLLLPPLGYISAAAVALVMLRLGAAESGKVVAGSVLATALLGALALGNPWLALFFLLALWLPIWVLAWTLRVSANLAGSFKRAALFGALLVLGMHLVVDDPAAWWTSVLQPLLEQAPAEQQQMLLPVLGEVARLMTGMIGAMTALGLIVSLLLARAWQASLYNPGGLRQEFYALRMGHSLAGVTVALLVAAWALADQAQILADLLPLALMLHLLQGLALVHALVAQRKANGAWLVALYVLLLLPMLMVQLAILLAAVGWLDTWLDLRTRWGSSPSE